MSQDTAAGPANGESTQPVISETGAFVAFVSSASDLVASDTNAATDVFRRDIGAAVTTRASVATLGIQANGPSSRPAMTNDGLTIAFDSTATNLVSSDTNGKLDVFVRRLTCSPSPCFPPTTRVSVATNGTEGERRQQHPVDEQ